MLNSIAQIMPLSAKRYGPKTALVTGGRKFSYDELETMSNKLANGLVGAGIKPGQVITLYGANSWQWVVSYYGILKSGAVVNPVNAMLTPREVEFLVDDCNAKVVIASKERGMPLLEKGFEAKVDEIIFWGNDLPDSITSFDSIMGSQSDVVALPEVSSDSISTICYTSGTTGKPKGAMLSHRSIILNYEMTSLMHGRTDGDVVVSALPCPHVYGNVVMNSCFARGSTLVLHSTFVEEEIIRSIIEYEATLFEGVPTMYMYLLNFLEQHNVTINTLRLCTVGGQNMPPSKMRAVERMFGCPLIELWGMTELGGLGATFPHNGLQVHGSIGVPLPHCQLKVVDVADPGKVLESDEIGELMVKGPIVMSGYFGNRGATEETIEADGWLHTGDLARVDSEGLFYIVDRKKDLIVTAGYNVYPAEIEEILAGHDAISMAAVGAIPDDQKGELAKAYVILKAGSVTTEEAIKTYCREYLAAYKVPREVQFVDDLPKTSSGKIMRRELINLHRSQP